MKSTPALDHIAQTMPLESTIKVRMFAALRLCCAIAVTAVCALAIYDINLVPLYVSPLMLAVGVWIASGRHSDSIEPIVRWLGPYVSWAILLCLFGVLALNISIKGGEVLFVVTFGVTIFFLIGVIWGLVRIIQDPLRATRYRQIQRYLKSLPRYERKVWRRDLKRSFDALVAQGFHEKI